MHDVKNTCNYKHFPLHGTHWCIKRLREKIHNDYNKIELFWNFYQLPRIYASLFKTKYKTVWIKFRKTLQERRLPISKFLQDNQQNNFFNFLTSKNIFITLKNSRDALQRFLWNVPLIFWQYYFVINGICQKINICYYQIIYF